MTDVPDAIWNDIRGLLIAESQLSGRELAVDTFYLERYIEYRNDLMALRELTSKEYQDTFFEKEYFYDITVDRLMARQEIFDRGLASGIGSSFPSRASSNADVRYVAAVEQFYHDIVVANVNDPKLIPGSPYWDDFYNSIVVTDKDTVYEKYLAQVASSRQNAIDMYTDFWKISPSAYPAPGTPEFDAQVSTYVHNVEFELPKSIPSPLVAFHNQQRQFYVEYYTRNPTLLPERNMELYSDYSKLVRYLYSSDVQFTDASMQAWQETAMADYDELRVKAKAAAAEFNYEEMNPFERDLMWYAKMKEYNVARQVMFGIDITNAYQEYFNAQMQFYNDLAKSQSQRYVMEPVEFQAWLEERPDYIEKVSTEMRTLFGSGITAPADKLTLVDIRNWYRRNGLADDGTPLEQEDEIKQIWDKVVAVATMDRDTAMNALSARFNGVGKFMKFGSVSLDDAEWQLFTRSSIYRNLALHMNYNTSFRAIRKSLSFISDYHSTIFWFLVAFMAYEFGCLKNAAFALYIDGLSEDKDQMDKDLKTCAEYNSLLSNSSFAFFPWMKGVMKEYHDAVELVIEAHKYIEAGFQYAQENATVLTAIVESIDRNVSNLAVLPDRIDKITWPLEHRGEVAGSGRKLDQFYPVGSVVKISIAKDNPMDISTWVKETHTVVSVRDGGDTLTLENGVNVRLEPSDADQMTMADGSPNPIGVYSNQAMSDKVLNKTVDVYMDPEQPFDVFGRTLAYVYLNGESVGDWFMTNVPGVLPYHSMRQWFSAIVYSVDEEYTSLDPDAEKYTHPEITTEEFLKQFPSILIKIPNYFVPFAAEEGDTVYLRISEVAKTVYDTLANCSGIDAPVINSATMFLGATISTPLGGLTLEEAAALPFAPAVVSLNGIEYTIAEGAAVNVPGGTLSASNIKFDSAVISWTSSIPPLDNEIRLVVQGPTQVQNYEYIKVDDAFLAKYVPSPCNKEVIVEIRLLHVCEEAVKTGEVEAVYDRIDGSFSIFTVTGSTYIISVPTDRVPANIGIGDTAAFAFKPKLPYIKFSVVVDSIESPWVTLVTTEKFSPQTFKIPLDLIPAAIAKYMAVDDKLEIEVGKNIGDYFVADFHARLGNNINETATFVRMPDNDWEINIPMHVVNQIVQEPYAPPDKTKLQINDMAAFKINDKSFTNSFKAELDRIDSANGIWKVLPHEEREITIPSAVAQEFLTAQTYASYPVCTISIKELKASSSYKAEQEVEIIATDVDNTTIQFQHLFFGTVQATLPTRLFSWLPAVGDVGIFHMANYNGLISQSMYVDSISESDARLISINKKDKGEVDYPIDRIPLYMKRFDVCRLQIRTHGWAKTPSGTVAQDIVDKYTKTKTLKSGIVKRRIPARVPNPLDMFVKVLSLDNGYAYVMTQRLDNSGPVDLPVYMVAPDTDVGDVLSLVVESYDFTQTYFTARFVSLDSPVSRVMNIGGSMATPLGNLTLISTSPPDSIVVSLAGVNYTVTPTGAISVAGGGALLCDSITATSADVIFSMGNCNFIIEPSGGYPFTIPLAMLPHLSVPGDIIGFKFRKKTSKDKTDLDFYLQITSIDAETITLKNTKTNTIFTLSQALLPYVRLPPDNSIINLNISSSFKLEVSKVVGHD